MSNNFCAHKWMTVMILLDTIVQLLHVMNHITLYLRSKYHYNLIITILLLYTATHTCIYVWCTRGLVAVVPFCGCELGKPIPIGYTPHFLFGFSWTNTVLCLRQGSRIKCLRHKTTSLQRPVPQLPIVYSTTHEAPLLQDHFSTETSLNLPIVYSTTHEAPLLQDHLSTETSTFNQPHTTNHTTPEYIRVPETAHFRSTRVEATQQITNTHPLCKSMACT